ncbi:unnamed protein product, partial [Prorocentrum cordatum]
DATSNTLDESILVAIEDRICSKMLNMWPKLLRKELGTLHSEISSLKGELKATKAQAEKAAEMASSAMESVRSLWAEVESLRKLGAQTDPVQQRSNNAGARTSQVIVGCFTEDTDQDDVIAKIEEFLKVGTRRSKVQEVFTFDDPCRIGVIQFVSEAAKRGFFKSIRKASREINGVKLRFADNRTFQERGRDKALSYVKQYLVDTAGRDAEDIRIWWKTGVVKAKGTKVAWVTKDATVHTSDGWEDMKTEVHGWIEEWFEVRGGRREEEDE